MTTEERVILNQDRQIRQFMEAWVVGGRLMTLTHKMIKQRVTELLPQHSEEAIDALLQQVRTDGAEYILKELELYQLATYIFRDVLPLLGEECFNRSFDKAAEQNVNTGLEHPAGTPPGN